MTSLSDADINMQENEFSSRGDVIADDDFVDVSLETSDGSRDTNMESDVFRRGRWRRPLSDLWELVQVLLTTEGIMSSTHLWNYIPSEEMDISRSFVQHVQYNNQLFAKLHVICEDYLCGCITIPSTHHHLGSKLLIWNYMCCEEADIYHVVGCPLLTMNLSLLGSLEDKWLISPCQILCRHFLGSPSHYDRCPHLDVRLGLRHYILDTSTFVGDKLTAINILRIVDPSEFSTLVTPSGISTDIYPAMDTCPIGVIVCLQQHDINALLMTLFWKLDLRFLGTSSIKRQHINVVIFVMVIISGDLISLHRRLLQL